MGVRYPARRVRLRLLSGTHDAPSAKQTCSIWMNKSLVCKQTNIVHWSNNPTNWKKEKWTKNENGWNATMVATDSATTESKRLELFAAVKLQNGHMEKSFINVFFFLMLRYTTYFSSCLIWTQLFK